MEEIHNKNTPGALFYITASSITSNDEEFKLHVDSCGMSRSFAMSPQHAKRLSLSLQSQLEQYEKRNGLIKIAARPIPAQEVFDKKLGFTFPKEELSPVRKDRVSARKKGSTK